MSFLKEMFAPSPPKTPTASQADIADEQRKARLRAQAAAGRQSTIFAGSQTAAGSPLLGRPTLTGPGGS